jgi:hypothetical protein
MKSESLGSGLRARSSSGYSLSVVGDNQYPVFNVVDPTVRLQQKEWENLLVISGRGETIPFPPDQIFGAVTQKHLTCAVWLVDAIHARAIEYPRTDDELEKLIVVRSGWFRIVFNVAAMFQILAPFLNKPVCLDTTGNGWGWFIHGGAPTITALAVFDIVSLSIFSYDLYLNLSVGAGHISILHRPWTLFRLVTTILLAGAVISTFAGNFSAQLYLRCMFPFLLISRRNNLKLMLQGLVHSVYYTLHVIFALMCIIVVWGLVGFFLFRELKGAYQHSQFDTPAHAISTTLHAFTTRPFTLEAFNRLYQYESMSGVWFVSLTVAADMLCTAFIIAVGTRQYRQFAANILVKRLLDRKKSAFSIFEGMATERGFALEDWRQICANISDKRYALSEDSAEHIFAMEDRTLSGFVDIHGFVRCLGSVAARIQFKRRGKLYGTNQISSETVHATTDSRARHVTDDGGDNLSDGEKVELRDTSTCHFPGNELNPMHDRDSARASSVSSPDAKGSNPQSAAANRLVIEVESLTTAERAIAEIDPTQRITVEAEAQIEHDNQADDPVVVNASSRANKEKAQPGGSSPLTVPLDPDIRESQPADVDAILRHTDVTPSQDGKASFNKQTELADWGLGIERYVGPYISRPAVCLLGMCHKLISFEVVIRTRPNIFRAFADLVSFNDATSRNRSKVSILRYNVPLYDSVFMFLVHVALVIQLGYISNPQASRSWHEFGWVLQGIFMFDMLMKLSVYGYNGLGSSKLSRHAGTFINIVSLIALLVLAASRGGVYGDAYTRPTPDAALATVLLVQSLRMFKLFFLVNDQGVFEDIYPTVFRAFFIMFSIIYFFGVFAHVTFCSQLVIDDAVLNADDDSSVWVPLADVLNFSSVLMSLFTMFQLSAQSNWSIVMAATAKQAGTRAYVFFYTYRLVMTLFVVPILMSFIMNSFVSAVVKKDRRFQTKQEEQENRDMVQGMTLDFDDNTGINAERAALESFSKYDPNMKQLPEEEFRVSGANNRSSTTSARDTMSAENPKEVAARGSIFQNIIGVMPSITFGSQPLRSARQKTSEKYSISSKSKDLSGPSMLSLWAGDEAPTTGQARETIKRNSMKSGSMNEDEEDDGSLSRQTFSSNIRTPRASIMLRQGSPGTANESFSSHAALEARVAALEVELENERLKNLSVEEDEEDEEEEKKK